jgi:signal transduction histidine kinase/CheY-like chemotaxis protein
MNDHAEPDTTGTPAVPAGRDSLYLQALHDKELGDLRALIAQLLMQLEVLQQQDAGAKTTERHVMQLREANAHLVMATFNAQDKQASAEASMQRQTDFLSMLAHELRNPLQPIANASTLLAKQAGSDPEQLRLHAIIARQMGHMTRLIDDLLDASRISSGKIGLDKSALVLADIVALAAEGSAPRLQARHQSLRIDQPDGEVRLYGDRVRLAQVFSNLLNNASKFSPEYEEIVLEAQVVGNMVQIAVRDNGMGMAPELQPFIFDLFTQGLQSLDRAQGGLGIGLTLVRSLVEMHGGTVRAHSAGIGQGSIFTVLLPLSVDVTAAAPLPLPPLPSPRSLRVLLVEDNIDAAATLALLLELGGHTVDQCHNGIDGVAQALRQHYDLVLCDIGLPGLDGFTVVERIRAGVSGKMPFFIATSGYNQAQDRARAIRSGFDHYLVKPVAIDMLLALIELHVH